MDTDPHRPNLSLAFACMSQGICLPASQTRKALSEHSWVNPDLSYFWMHVSKHVGSTWPAYTHHQLRNQPQMPVWVVKKTARQGQSGWKFLLGQPASLRLYRGQVGGNQELGPELWHVSTCLQTSAEPSNRARHWVAFILLPFASKGWQGPFKPDQNTILISFVFLMV